MSEPTLTDVATLLDDLDHAAGGGAWQQYAATVRKATAVMEEARTVLHAQAKLAVCYRINRTPTVEVTRACGMLDEVVTKLTAILGVSRDETLARSTRRNADHRARDLRRWGAGETYSPKANAVHTLCAVFGIEIKR